MRNFLIKGGVLMWPLLLLSVLSVGVIIERLVYFLWLRRKEGEILVRISAWLEAGQIERCQAECKRANNLFKGLIEQGLSFIETGPKKLEEVVARLGSELLEEMERRLSLLSVIAQIAPLLRLLGTVLGGLGLLLV